MTPDAAYAMLARMTQADQVPTLVAVDLAALLALARRADITGLAPSDPLWAPTYDLNAAACEGWRWKAGAVAGLYDWKSSQQEYFQSQMFAACQEMVKHYQRRIGGSPSMAGATSITAGGIPFITRPLA